MIVNVKDRRMKSMLGRVMFFKLLSVVLLLVIIAFLVLLVPLQGALNLFTWFAVLAITIITVIYLWVDINILDLTSAEIRAVWTKLGVASIPMSERGLMNLAKPLTIDAITTALEDTPFHNEWLRIIGNGVNVYKVAGSKYIKEDIHNFFEADILLGRLKRHSWRQQIPNLLTGAGILGTFLGLTVGLYKLDIFSNGKNLIEQMGVLINSSGTAFITSLVGIALSLWYTITLITFTKTLKSEYKFVVDYLHFCVPYKTESEYLADIITGNAQSSEAMVSHIESIKSVFTQSMDEIINQVGTIMGDMVSDQVKDLNQKVDALNNTVTNASLLTQTFSNTINTYTKTIEDQTNSVTTFVNSMRYELQDANERNRDTNIELLESFKHYLVDTSNVATSMEIVYNKIEKSMSRLTDACTQSLQTQGTALKSVINKSIDAFTNAEKAFVKEKAQYFNQYVEEQNKSKALLEKQIQLQEEINEKLLQVLHEYNEIKRSNDRDREGMSVKPTRNDRRSRDRYSIELNKTNTKDNGAYSNYDDEFSYINDKISKNKPLR